MTQLHCPEEACRRCNRAADLASLSGADLHIVPDVTAACEDHASLPAPLPGVGT